MQRLTQPHKPSNVRSRFTREKTDVPRCYVTCPRSYGAEPDLEFGTAWPQSHESFLILFLILEYFKPIEKLEKKVSEHLHLDSPTHILPHFLCLPIDTHTHHDDVDPLESNFRPALRKCPTPAPPNTTGVHTRGSLNFKIIKFK